MTLWCPPRLRRGARALLVGSPLVLAVVLVVGNPQSASALAPGISPVALSARPTPAHVTTSQQGPLSAAGGPYLRDDLGRVVFLHGVNAVYKYAPYELYSDPGKPWDFSATDASEMARLGFNVVRLGITWAGLEPGTGPANDPAICTQGATTDPHQFDAAVTRDYLSHIAQTVNLLGQYHIYTILDMHQDLYSQVFGGEGAPSWAVCTNGLPVVRAPGRWSNTYRTDALDAAFTHFWKNDVTGDLQGEFDQVWATVASYFSTNPWVVGYDPINEPFSKGLLDEGDHDLDAQIECAYTGTADPGLTSTGQPLSCPSQDPSEGLIPTILAADPHRLILYETDVYSAGVPNDLGPMNYPNLVLNFHDYCPYRNPVTGDPTNEAACDPRVQRTIDGRAQERATLGSDAQPRGPGLFMSEFGATSDPTSVGEVVTDANQDLVGWTYWSWKYYHDPTGSSHEGLVDSTGQFEPTADALSETYAQTVAGTPVSMSDNADGSFHLSYVPDDTIDAPTVIFVPVQLHYPQGYCASATGAAVVSKAGATFLDVMNHRNSSMVDVNVRSGSCAN